MPNKRSLKLISRVGILVILAAFMSGASPKKKEKAPAPAQPSTIVDPRDPKSILYLDSQGNVAGTGDVTKSGVASAAAKAGAGWHPAALSAAIVPKDKYGLVDWAKAAKENLISPKHTITGTTDPDDEPMDMDVEIIAKGDFVNDVIYPHAAHTYWFSCDGCHDKIFQMAAGQNNMTMSGIAEGKWCGKCHGKVAFPLSDCNRCHTKPKPAAK